MPKFGPSQRLELSQSYLNNNTSKDRCKRFRLYEPIPPHENIVEDGQVVMLLDTRKSTEVIPDPAGYQVEEDVEQLDEKQRMFVHHKELKGKKFGVNQGQKCVDKISNLSGRGYDISLIKGHDVTIMHTGHEPIARNQLVGVRFPTEEDMQAQADAWRSNNSRGLNVSKFATYPIDENASSMLSETFYKELLWQKQKRERAYVISNNLDAVVEQIQVPSLLSVIKTVLNAQEKDELDGTLQQIKIASDSSAYNVDEILSRQGMVEFLTELSDQCITFVESLRSPAIVARCTGFRNIHSNDMRVAKCGDQLVCQIY